MIITTKKPGGPKLNEDKYHQQTISGLDLGRSSNLRLRRRANLIGMERVKEEKEQIVVSRKGFVDKALRC